MRNIACVLAASVLLAWGTVCAAERIRFEPNEKEGRLKVAIDGKEAFTYFHGADLDLPYIVPRSPAGKAMTIVQTNPYPHHRSIWFADRVQLAGQRVGRFYNALYSRADKNDPNSLFRDRIRHVKSGPMTAKGDGASVRIDLLWELDGKTPVLDERRDVRIRALGGGEFLLDITFTVTASYGEVKFLSDAVHYAWPYVRMHPEFSVKQGGRITNSAGGVNQKGTHGKAARWVDYSNTTGGKNAGLAVFSHGSNAHPHSWLTRDYGTFGPRRADARSGKRFALPKGKSLATRIGILVHRGDVKEGKVAERYAEYAKP